MNSMNESCKMSHHVVDTCCLGCIIGQRNTLKGNPLPSSTYMTSQMPMID